jgi:suppressor of G2 allele of SKP1
MSSAFQAANALFVDDDFAGALQRYNEAIAAEPQNAEYLIKRSACHAKLKNWTDAVADANSAIKLAPSNATAYIRKGTACFSMNEFESALASFQKALALDPQNAQVKTWIRKCDAELELDGEAEAMSVSSAAPAAVAQVPPPVTPAAAAPPQPEPVPQTQPQPQQQPQPAPAQPQPPPAQPQPPGPVSRYDWLQSPNYVEIVLYGKNISKEQCFFDIADEAVRLRVESTTGAQPFQLEICLCDAVVPSATQYTYLPMKVEIQLQKKKAGEKWVSLERPKNLPQAVTPWGDVTKVNKAEYPTSGKKKIDWEQLAREEQDDKLEGDAALQKVFQDIYKGGSEEQRRAMMKSFVESGGTVLSTNWDEVGKGEVKGSAPAGQEMRKW